MAHLWTPEIRHEQPDVFASELERGLGELLGEEFKELVATACAFFCRLSSSQFRC